MSAQIGFFVRIDGMGQREVTGEQISLYVHVEGSDYDDDRLVTDKDQATIFARLPFARGYLDRRPGLARQAHVIHSLTGMEVWP